MHLYPCKMSPLLEGMSQVAVFLLCVSSLVCFEEIQADLRSCSNCNLALRECLKCSTHCSQFLSKGCPYGPQIGQFKQPVPFFFFFLNLVFPSPEGISSAGDFCYSKEYSSVFVTRAVIPTIFVDILSLLFQEAQT